MKSVLVMLILMMGAVMLQAPVWAKPSTAGPGAHSKIDVVMIKLKIQKVLSEPVFGETKREKRLTYVGDKERKEEPDSSNLFAFFREFSLWLSRLSEVLLWGLVLVAVALLIKYRHKWWGLFVPIPTRAQVAPPQILFGLDVRPESLPEDIPGEVMKLWRAGERLAAMSLLYRGALVKLIHQHGVAIMSSYTEGQCIEEVNGKVAPAMAAHFMALTEAWLLTAYAHRPPENDHVTGLCADYKTHFMVST